MTFWACCCDFHIWCWFWCSRNSIFSTINNCWLNLRQHLPHLHTENVLDLFTLMHSSKNDLLLNDSSELQSSVYNITFSCQCCQCEDIIAACCLNDSSESHDASHQQVVTECVLQQMTFVLSRIVNKEESCKLRRILKESLYEF